MSEEVESSFEEKIAGVLFNFSIAREDIKEIAGSIPDNASISSQTGLYELQILKIISIGVSINYLISEDNLKNKLSKSYWEYIFEFSKSVTKATKEYSNVDLDYFEAIKQKLNAYLNELNQNKTALEPAAVIGPCFAFQCGDRENPYAVMAGAKLFKMVLESLKTYFAKEGFLS